MTEFRPLRESELDHLGDQALVDYIVAAREAGDAAAERRAVGVLAFAFEEIVKAWVRKDMGSAPQDVDDVVMDVMQSAIRSSFEGKVIGEFGSFLKTIAARRVVDYFRRRGRRPREAPLPAEHEGEGEGEDGIWGVGPSHDGGAGVTELRDAVERVLASRSQMHRKVIRLYGPNVAGFMDLPAAEVKARIDADGSGDSVGVDNVAQIWSRFKRDLEAELDA